MNKTFTLSQVREYVEGWRDTSADANALSLNEIKAMLNNALVSIDCEQDGLAAYIERQKYYAKIEGKALGVLWHIARDATLINRDELILAAKQRLIMGLPEHSIIEELEQMAKFQYE